MNKPGGNATGVFQYFGALGGKRLELLRELVPGASLVAVLSNPNNPNAEDHLYDVETAARTMGQAIQVFKAGTEAVLSGRKSWHSQRSISSRRSTIAASSPRLVVSSAAEAVRG